EQIKGVARCKERLIGGGAQAIALGRRELCPQCLHLSFELENPMTLLAHTGITSASCQVVTSAWRSAMQSARTHRSARWIPEDEFLSWYAGEGNPRAHHPCC